MNKINEIISNHDLLSVMAKFGFTLNKDKSTRKHKSLSNSQCTLIYNVDTKRYFNPLDDNDFGNIINFMMLHTTYRTYRDIFSYFDSNRHFSSPDITTRDTSNEIKDFSFLEQFKKASHSTIEKALSKRKIPILCYKHHLNKIFQYTSSITSYLFIPIHRFTENTSVISGGLILPSKTFIAGSSNANSVYFYNRDSSHLNIYETYFDLIAHQCIKESASDHHSISINGRITKDKVNTISNYINKYAIKTVTLAFDNDIHGIFYSIYLILTRLKFEFNYSINNEIITLTFKNQDDLLTTQYHLKNSINTLDLKSLSITINSKFSPITIHMTDISYNICFSKSKDWNEDFILNTL